MTAPNHISAGLFFAGFWASFWNINIFQRPQYVAIAILASLLPDVDHPRTAIGLSLYPISSWLNTRYGHRTVTHSLLFLIISTLFVLFLDRNLLPAEWKGITVIFFFGFLSHLLLDMITLQGVPLLYPFRRNPCVIPGKTRYRIRSGNLRSEFTGFLIFCSLNVLCTDLYRQGFWFTYNNTFSTIEHVHYERANAANFTLCRYVYIWQGQQFSGLAPIIDSRESSLDLLIKGNLIRLDYSTAGLIVKEVKPVRTGFPFKYITRNFSNDSAALLNKFCRNRIVSGNIQSANSFTLHFSKPGNNGIEESKTTTSTELTNFTQVSISIPHTGLDEKKNILRQIAIKKQSLAQDRLHFNKANAEYYVLVNRKKLLAQKITSAKDIGERNTLENELIRIKNRIQFTPEPVYIENTVTLETIKQLYLQLNDSSSIRPLFDATLSYLDLPDSLTNISKK